MSNDKYVTIDSDKLLKLISRYIETTNQSYTVSTAYKQVGISKTSWYRKLNGKCEFSISEFYKICDSFGLLQSDIEDILVFNRT